MLSAKLFDTKFYTKEYILILPIPGKEGWDFLTEGTEKITEGTERLGLGLHRCYLRRISPV